MQEFSSTMLSALSPYLKSIQHTHTHTRLMALCPGLPSWAGTRKVKPIWILLEQETVSGSGISWAICKSAPRSRQITMPAPHYSVFFTGRMPFLSPNQQCQSTEGTLLFFFLGMWITKNQQVTDHFWCSRLKCFFVFLFFVIEIDL